MQENDPRHTLEQLRQISLRLETVYNRLFFRLTDCREFVHWLDGFIELHLYQIKAYKTCLAILSEELDIPSKQQISLYAKKLIEIEQLADDIEEKLWEIEEQWKKFRMAQSDRHR